MKHTKVGTVMTRDVVTVRESTPFKKVARLLEESRISGLPVLDDDEHVIGVVSETDLMQHQAGDPGPVRHPALRRWKLLVSGTARRRLAKSRATNAGSLMSTPAVTVHADDSIAEAARTMAEHHIERLPVLDAEDRMVGIVARRDILQVFLRPDEEIRTAVLQDVVVGALWLAPQTINVSVHNGVVTLHGQVERLSEKPIALHMTSLVDGVVAVVDRLTYRLDDSHLQPAELAVHGVTESWLRKL